MVLYWRPNPTANWIELQQINLSLIGTLDYLTNPIEHDITESIKSLGSNQYPTDILCWSSYRTKLR
ncbi:hypothetical protein [Tissierella sp. P1]|uniref:hypothetical protein n=1 Tax=Tissierella sp. P1 TaxID=1280483 RepID=UPI001914113B|nr:hypothetical protein [Tissierella sp. P1]